MKRLLALWPVLLSALSFLGLIGLAILLRYWLGDVLRPPTLTPTEKFIFAVKIKAEDLPWGWREDMRVGIEHVPGAEGRFFIFHGTIDPALTWVNVSETVLVFDSVEAAQKGYSVQVNEYIPAVARDKWKHVPELDFPHHADEMETACLSAYINNLYHQACRGIARYQNVVIIVLGNVFEDQWLRMSEFRAVLEAADRRIVPALKR